MSSISTNIAAYYAQNNLRTAANAAQASIARLSSGNAIVSASDNVAGLSIGTILRTTVSTLKTASTNASQGISLLQVADGALSSLGDILQRQKALAVQGNSGTLSDTERGYLNQEFQALTSEYDRIVAKTNFNGVTLLDGTLAASSTSIATVAPTTLTSIATDTNNPPATTVITGGAGGLTLTSFGTSTAGQDALQGSLANVAVSSVYSGGTTLASLQVVINGVTFRSAFNSFNTNATSTIALTQVLSAADTTAGKTATVLQLTTANQGNATASQVGSTAAALAVQKELAKITLYQGRVLQNTASVDPSAITTAKFSGTVLQGLSGADFTIKGNGFDSTTGFAPSLTDFQITSNSATNASFSVQVNGVTYNSASTPGNSGGIDLSAHTNIALDDLDGTTGAGTGVLRLTSVNDANAYIDINLATNTSGVITLGSQSDADGLAAALNGGFGSGSTGGLKFQVGTASSDTIGISVSSIKSNAVYKDSLGVTKTLDISTAAGAVTASDVLGNAIQTITSSRASIGALQSRFNYATATLNTSIQNLDAARGQFLDTDVSAESTKFATEQVLQQAAISVLAQANQIPQNLLKLIG